VHLFVVVVFSLSLLCVGIAGGMLGIHLDIWSDTTDIKAASLVQAMLHSSADELDEGRINRKPGADMAP
jgi:hypothetical protein